MGGCRRGHLQPQGLVTSQAQEQPQRPLRYLQRPGLSHDVPAELTGRQRPADKARPRPGLEAETGPDGPETVSLAARAIRKFWRK